MPNSAFEKKRKCEDRLRGIMCFIKKRGNILQDVMKYFSFIKISKESFISSLVSCH